MKSKLYINSGLLKGKNIFFLYSEKTKPTKSDIKYKLFSYLNIKIKKYYVIDLFAGSGIINFEFISNGSTKNIMIEMCKKNYENIIKNKKNIFKKNKLINIFLENSYKWLKKNNILNTSIIIYDPPYNFNLTNLYFKLFNEIIFLRKCTLLFIESKNSYITKYILKNWFLIKKEKKGKTQIYLFKII